MRIFVQVRSVERFVKNFGVGPVLNFINKKMEVKLLFYTLKRTSTLSQCSKFVDHTKGESLSHQSSLPTILEFANSEI